MRSTSLFFAPALLVLAACAGQATEDAGGTGGSGGGTADGGAGSGEACERFDDDDPGSVEITVRNGKSGPIYLGQRSVTCSQTSYFEVRGADGVSLAQGSPCMSTCEDWRDGAPQGCPLICLYPTAIFLAPGETTRLGWDGRFFAAERLPADCASGAEEAVDCFVPRRVPAGSLTFLVEAGSGPDCSETTGECGICENPPTGGCHWPAALVTGESYSARTTVDFDPATTTAVEIVFED